MDRDELASAVKAVFAQHHGEATISCTQLRSVLRSLQFRDVDICTLLAVTADADDASVVRCDHVIDWIFGKQEPEVPTAVALPSSPSQSVQRPGLEDVAEAQAPSGPSLPLPRWHVGALVERVIDDVSDIWTGAVVTAVDGDCYDIQYADTSATERGVEEDELRDRSPQMLFTAEMWSLTVACVRDAQTLCALECVETGARGASVRAARDVWSVAYHCKFGSCGTRCTLHHADEDGVDVDLAKQAAPECARVAEDPDLSPLSSQRLPWKEKYAKRHLDGLFAKRRDELLLAGYMDDTETSLSPAGSPQLDGRLLFGRNALKGQVYDGMLGRMIAEDGGPANRVTICRGKTMYSH
eukprot:TRINITY_DN67884_c0_g1_i1.p1 TRINITY_DN67884_c0_g1~~TRINITY_DN67884_c0_g1_i1.p1  ORF type:complete len:370 (-),score=56.29 TRINITY_DN67884_c0_g1_i1:105-1166(-)